MKKIMILVLVLLGQMTFNIFDIEAGVFTKEDKRIFLDSMNKYRVQKGLKEVTYCNDAERLAKIRITTISNHRKEVLSSITKEEYRKDYLRHLHFGLYEDIELFNVKLRSNRKSNYVMITPSENIAIFFENDGKLLYSLFDGWKNSPSHWEAMMDETTDTVALEMEKTDVGVIACLILFEKFNKK